MIRANESEDKKMVEVAFGLKAVADPTMKPGDWRLGYEGESETLKKEKKPCAE